MSDNILLHLFFTCVKLDGVATLADNYLPRMQVTDEAAALQFLADLSSQSIRLSNGTLNWTFLSKDANPEAFVTCLRPFWEELLRSEVEGGPRFYEQTVVLYQMEDATSASSFEIRMSGKDLSDRANCRLAIRHFHNVSLFIQIKHLQGK